MATRWQLTVVALCTLLAVSAHADIYRWDTGEVIPGSEGIEPGPGVYLRNWNTDSRNLRFADFSGGEDLSAANFNNSWLDDADFSWANLSGAVLADSTLTNADLTGAVVTGASFSGTTWHGFTKEQLYSTASYQQKNLHEIELFYNDLTGWDFSGQDLTSAALGGATLANADLTGAVITGASLHDTTAYGLTKEQLYSTTSYQQKALQGVILAKNDLTGWDFSGQDLTDAAFRSWRDLFVASDLTGVNLSGAVVTGVDFGVSNLATEQLYSTASYKAKDLQRISLGLKDLTGWDFSGQDLSHATFVYYAAFSHGSNLSEADLVGANLKGADLTACILTNADLTGANLSNALLRQADSLPSAILDAATVYNQWTVFPDGFDTVSAGLTLVPSPAGDFDADDMLSARDVDWLSNRAGRQDSTPWWLPDAMFDLNSDETIDQEDHRMWVEDLKHTWFGDANLDGEFNSSDMVQIFAAGKYETGENAGWAEGDWDASGFFSSRDMVAAFVDGGYEKGPQMDAAAVPEPSGWLLLMAALTSWMVARRSRRPI